MQTRQTVTTHHPNGQVRLFRAALGLNQDQEIILFHPFLIGCVVGYEAALAVTVAIYYFFLQAASFAQYKFLELNQVWENHIPGGGITVDLAFYTLVTIFLLKVTPRRIWRTSLECWGRTMAGAIHLWFSQKRRLDAILNLGIVVMAHVVIVLALIYADPWAFQYHRDDDAFDAPLGQSRERPQPSAPEVKR